MNRIEPHQARIADLGRPFRPQREWAEGRGLLLIVAHFLTGAGAATWFFAALRGFEAGLAAGFALVAVGGLCHLLFLGRPERFWRMMANVAGSWISRGLAGMVAFLAAAAAYLLRVQFDAGETAFSRTLFVVSLLGALWIVGYKGFVWASGKGIPLWNTPLIPVLYIAYALRAGTAVLVVLESAPGAGGLQMSLEAVKLWLAISTAVLVLVYVSVMRGSGVTALRSVELLLFGRVALPFYAGAVALGLVVPISVGGFAAFAAVPSGLIVAAAVFSLLGDLSIIYCIARAGLYRPLPV
ncbi:MAG TPA: DmsC/YnfH family molybdoenzyme membrane anchor subunit [candidate division Zixibacteria bacterium]|nr:DmsC/YnfH family molybdoenzyme membrane anchor subunit [candidate division Zixibacteria bacterium]